MKIISCVPSYCDIPPCLRFSMSYNMIQVNSPRSGLTLLHAAKGCLDSVPGTNRLSDFQVQPSNHPTKSVILATGSHASTKDHTCARSRISKTYLATAEARGCQSKQHASNQYLIKTTGVVWPQTANADPSSYENHISVGMPRAASQGLSRHETGCVSYWQRAGVASAQERWSPCWIRGPSR